MQVAANRYCMVMKMRPTASNEELYLMILRACERLCILEEKVDELSPKAK